jgi:hypothetical protein
MMPVPLSYFSPIVGGLPGAAALGMEPTYYWDAMTPRALARLDERAGERGVVLFVANPIAPYYKEAGLLEARLYPRDGRNPDWYVLQNRPGAMSEADRAVVRRQGSDPRYILSKKLGVPLVWAFPAEAVEDRR